MYFLEHLSTPLVQVGGRWEEQVPYFSPLHIQIIEGKIFLLALTSLP